jgi:hypothetical protein
MWREIWIRARILATEGPKKASELSGHQEDGQNRRLDRVIIPENAALGRETRRQGGHSRDMNVVPKWECDFEISQIHNFRESTAVREIRVPSPGVNASRIRGQGPDHLSELCAPRLHSSGGIEPSLDRPCLA